MSHAWLGRKECGCPTWARLCEAPAKKFPRELTVKKVHVDRASVSICRCGDPS